MRLAQYFDASSAMNLSGILVSLLVAVLSVFAVQDSSSVAVVAGLSLAQLLCFLAFLGPVHLPDRSLFALLWVEAGLIVALYLLVENSFVAILSIVWIVQATELYGTRRGYWLLLGSVIVFAASQFYHARGADILNAAISALMFGLFQFFAFSAARRAILERQLRQETAALNRELIATRELLSQAAAQSERVRIARDLHDILGHHMTALILNLEVASHLAQGRAREKVEQAQALARLLLGDLRTTVSELREEHTIDLQQSIDALIGNLPGLAFDVDFSAAPVIEDVELAEILLRCAQEAITNVLRHSIATRCQISLTEIDHRCVLTVSDNGRSKGEIEPGNGLKGMAERVAENGGELTWQKTARGFSLRVALMLRTAR